MAGPSKIEWTEATWNPVAGCTVLTPGCTNCYAMKMAARLESMGQELYAGLTRPSKAGAVWTGVVRLAPEHVLLAPLKRKKPTTYFVNSMSDLFHEDVPDEWIGKVFAVMALAPQHTFQVLTKRAERMRKYVSDPRWSPIMDVGGMATVQWPLPNVWLGVSAERQQEADERIPHLLQTPAAIRFVSAEPLLGPIDLSSINTASPGYSTTMGANLDWIIVGGESGSNARPMHPDWARSLRDQCAAAGVAYFFKQWGAWGPDHGYSGEPGHDPIFEGKGPCAKFVKDKWEVSENGYTMPLGDDDEWMYHLGKKAAGRLLDGIEHNAMPSLPSALAATPNQSHSAMPARAEG